MKNLVIGLINFYQTFLSLDRGIFALLVPGGACKYEITCSEYTKQAVAEHGILKGLFLGFRRILSCR